MTPDPASQIAELLSRVKPERDSVLTIGVFDGVHLGHQALLRELRARAQQRGMLSGVITFQSHPRRVLQPSARLPFLNGVEDRLRKIRNLGIDLVVAIPFTGEIARLSAREFLAILQKYLNMKGLVVGPDFALGRKREGNIAQLRQLGQEMGFTVEVINPVIVSGEVVSSTLLRNTLARGDMRRAAKMLGQPFYLTGKVVAGTRHGLELGFPTANLEVHPGQALPLNGVYATITDVDGKSYNSVTNIGTRPTFGTNPQTIETFLIDFSGDLYGQTIKVNFIERLRNEERFSSPEDLKRQIQKDVAQARALLVREKMSLSKCL